MTKENRIYERFDRATYRMEAWAILRKGRYVGRVVIKRGDSRVTAFVQIFGATMTSGYADGGGYDKNSAAVEVATRKLQCLRHSADDPQALKDVAEFTKAILEGRDGAFWYNRLEGEFAAHNITG